MDFNAGLTVTLRQKCGSEVWQSAEGRLHLQMSCMLCSSISDGNPCRLSHDTVGVKGSEKVFLVGKGAAGGRVGIRRCLSLV